jgi:hypothetical protein
MEANFVPLWFSARKVIVFSSFLNFTILTIFFIMCKSFSQKSRIPSLKICKTFPTFSGEGQFEIFYCLAGFRNHCYREKKRRWGMRITPTIHPKTSSELKDC